MFWVFDPRCPSPVPVILMDGLAGRIWWRGLEVGRKLVALGRCCLLILRGEHLTDDLITVA